MPAIRRLMEGSQHQRGLCADAVLANHADAVEYLGDSRASRRTYKTPQRTRQECAAPGLPAPNPWNSRRHPPFRDVLFPILHAI